MSKSLYRRITKEAQGYENMPVEDWKEITREYIPLNKELIIISSKRSYQQRQEAARALLEDPTPYLEFVALVLLLSDEALGRMIHSFAE